MRRSSTGLASVVAMLACLFAAGEARAQSESRTWYVPWSWSLSAGADMGSIAVVNLNGEAVRVNVRAFNAQGAALSASSSAFSLQPAGSSSVSFPVDPRGPAAAAPAFVLVLAERPVLVRARAAAVLRPYVDREKDCQRITSRGEPDGVLFCDGQLGRYDAQGKFQYDSLETWKYATLREWPAFPIDCTGSAPTHFVCSKRVVRELPGAGDVGGTTPVDRVERETDPDR
mgnify:CR=1 FL=1